MKFFLLVVFTLLLWPQAALAQTEFREITISPFLQELEVAKGGSVAATIDVTNNSEQGVVLNLSTRDFLPGDRGEPQFVPDDEYNDVTYSLASWIKLESGSRVELEPNETKTIPYTINPPTNAEQGSHYGAILFSMSDGATLSGVGITQSIGTIIIVSYGEARSEGYVEFSGEPSVVWWNEKIEFANQFVNTGRVHVKPKGEITIKNLFGQEVSTLTINRDASNVLPQSDRTFISDWYPSPYAFGPYFAESVITYGEERLEARNEIVVWVLPIYTLVLLGIILATLLWYLLHGRHWHRRRVIKKHLS
jgi:hypothetical protein